MTTAEAVAVLGGGVGAGIVNAAVGSGTLITFPILLAVGYSPVTANVSNTIGLVPGSLSAAIGYREQLRGGRRLIARLALPSLLGAVLGAVLLLALPSSAFDAIVPIFIAIAIVLVVLGPRLTRAALARPRTARHERALLASLFACGVYGGYFGAAQGIIVLALLGAFFAANYSEVNGMKNVLVMLVNLVAGAIFAFSAHVAWGAAALIAVGSIAGAQVGARVAKRLPPAAFRAIVVCVGTIALVRLVTT
jgi:uncharacterized protein